MMRSRWLVASTLVWSACVSGLDTAGSSGAGPAPDAGSSVTSTPTDFDNAMLQMAGNYRRSFSRVNTSPYLSTVGSFDINSFAYGDTRDYRSIHPEDTTTTVSVSVGTLIVREVLDDTGTVTKLTMMAKGPAGYDPTLGDWWFAETDPTGKPLTGDAGLQVGRLTACHSCHVPRASTDYLFGVPRTDMRTH